jgi:hypothetical protein
MHAAPAPAPTPTPTYVYRVGFSDADAKCVASTEVFFRGATNTHSSLSSQFWEIDALADEGGVFVSTSENFDGHVAFSSSASAIGLYRADIEVLKTLGWAVCEFKSLSGCGCGCGCGMMPFSYLYPAQTMGLAPVKKRFRRQVPSPTSVSSASSFSDSDDADADADTTPTYIFYDTCTGLTLGTPASFSGKPGSIEAVWTKCGAVTWGAGDGGSGSGSGIVCDSLSRCARWCRHAPTALAAFCVSKCVAKIDGNTTLHMPWVKNFIVHILTGRQFISISDVEAIDLAYQAKLLWSLGPK